MKTLKQVIVVRTDLKMGRGKLAAQAAHASVQCFYKTLIEKRTLAEEWIRTGQKKVVLKVSSIDTLLKKYNEAIELGLIACIIRDAGHTQLDPGTITALGIGPDYEDKIDKVTGELKLL